MRSRSSKRRVHVHMRRRRSPLGGPGTATASCSSTKPEQKVEPPAAALQDSALKILGEIIASLERARDVHKSDLDGHIARLEQIHEFAVKASETNAPKQRAPHTIGGFLVV